MNLQQTKFFRDYGDEKESVAPGRTPAILHIDDSRDEQYLLKEMFAAAIPGVRVISCDNILEAIQRLTFEPEVRLIILDHYLDGTTNETAELYLEQLQKYGAPVAVFSLASERQLQDCYPSTIELYHKDRKGERALVARGRELSYGNHPNHDHARHGAEAKPKAPAA